MKKIISSVAFFLLIVTAYFFIDKPLALFFHNKQYFYSFFHIITKFGEAHYSLGTLFLLFLFFWFKKKSYFQNRTLYLFSAIALSGIIVDILKVIFGRFRPALFFKEELYGFSPMHFGSLYNSFPSGHSATAFSLGVGLALLFPKYRYFFILFAVLVAFSRVILGFHYLSDIVVGSFIGALTAIYLYPKFIKEENAKVS